MSTRPEKPASASVTSVQLLTLPSHANHYGKVHGGMIMKFIDEAGGICAMRHSQRPAVTVAIDSMTFQSSVEVGEVLCCDAILCHVGRTAMEVEVKVHAEQPLTGKTTHTNSARLVYVAIDEAGKPVPVPGLRIETADDERRYQEGEERQTLRLSQLEHT